MSIALWFWIIFVIALVFYGVLAFRNRTYTPDLVFWLLVFLLGLQVFGSPIK